MRLILVFVVWVVGCGVVCGDERKVTLDLMVFYVIQRLNAQKWLAWN